MSPGPSKARTESAQKLPRLFHTAGGLRDVCGLKQCERQWLGRPPCSLPLCRPVPAPPRAQEVCLRLGRDTALSFQMVWATTTKIGCAVNTCRRMNVWGDIWENAVYLVCNYSPK